MQDLKITELPPMPSMDLRAADPLAIASLGASETRKITAKELMDHGVLLLEPRAIPGDKLDLRGLDGSSFVDGSLPVSKLKASTVPANGGLSVAGGLLQLGAPTAPLSLSGTGSLTHLPSGVVAGSYAKVTVDEFGHVTLGGPLKAADLPIATTTDVGAISVGNGLAVTAGGMLHHKNVVLPGTASGISYDADGHITGAVALASSDLPIASAGLPGAVSPGPGLTVNTAGALSLTPATRTELGGVIIGGDLSAAGGVITLSTQQNLAAGYYAKVSVNNKGLVIGGATLTEADIPALDTSKIATGAFTTDRYGDHSVTAIKLADYSIAYIQESIPPAGVGLHSIGMLWFQESTGQVSIWNGNSWMKTGPSVLFNRNLRYCGTYDAATGAILGVTQFGTADGFKIGAAIPPAEDQHAGAYFVAIRPGSLASLAGGDTFDNGDWLLNQGTTGGWVRVDTLSGGGVGHGASVIDDLLDVTISSPPQVGQFLGYTNTGQFANISLTKATDAVAGIAQLATQVEADAGVDASKIITPALLKKSIAAHAGAGVASATAPLNPALGQVWTDTSNLPPVVKVWDATTWLAVGAAPPDATASVKGVVALATTAEVTAGVDAAKALTANTLQNCTINGGTY